MVRTKKAVDIENDVTEEKESRVNVYEVGYIMVPTIPEESLGEEVTLLKDIFTEKGASLISDEYPKLIELAYEMSRSILNKKQKFSYGYFGWVKFECNTDQAKIVKELLDKNEKLVRFLMVKTVRENTMSVKRSYGKQDGSKRRPVQKSKEAPEAIDEEVIDKEIDALVV